MNIVIKSLKNDFLLLEITASSGSRFSYRIDMRNEINESVLSPIGLDTDVYPVPVSVQRAAITTFNKVLKAIAASEEQKRCMMNNAAMA